jgi:hypothetical protein
MKKYLPFTASLVLLAVSACTPSPNETTSSNKPASTSTSSDKAKNTDSKPVSSDTSGWQDYTSEAGKFSVQMPTKPQELSQEKKTDIGIVKINMALSESSSSAYIVGYNDFPSKFTDAEIPTRLNLGAKGFMTGSMKGTITSSKETKLGEIPCLDFDGTGKIQAFDAKAKGRICIADNARLYQVVMATPSNKFSQADADRFISSFKIKK